MEPKGVVSVSGVPKRPSEMASARPLLRLAGLVPWRGGWKARLQCFEVLMQAKYS